MKFEIRTKVNGNYKNVMDKFDIDLFKALKPPVGRMEIVEFTGSKTGDKVHLKFLSPIKAEWISDIVEDSIDNEKAYFIDIGSKLPPGLIFWRHKHIVENTSENTATIVDAIFYYGSNKIIEALLFPILYSSFLLRKPIYKKYFK